MKRINRLVLCLILSFFIFLTACDSASSHGIDAYYSQPITPWEENKYIGLHTENKPLDKHELDIYYGLPSGVVSEIFENYANYSAFTDFDHEVKFTIKRRIYEDYREQGTAIEYKEKEIFTKTDKLSFFISYDFVYGINSVKDTISLDDVYDNEGGYGYIKYDWYLTEIDGSSLKMNSISEWKTEYADVIPKSRLSVVKSTGALYYTINDNLITFKVAKKSTIYN